MHDERTPVVFRRWRDTGDIIALFPSQPADSSGRYCDAYEHVGQHGAADYDAVIAATKPVTPEDASPLADELSRLGYRLQPVRRASRRIRRSRRSEARAGSI